MEVFHLITGLNHWQIDGVVFWLLLQGVVAAVPEEIIMLSLGVLISHHRVGWAEAFLAVELGLLPANMATVFIAGRFSKGSLLQKPAIKNAMEKVRKRGKWVIAMTRFTPLVRSPVYASIGLSGMSVFDFFKVDGMVSLIHVPLLLSIGYWIGMDAGSIASAYRMIGIGVATFLVFFLTVAFARDRIRRRSSVLLRNAG